MQLRTTLLALLAILMTITASAAAPDSIVRKLLLTANIAGTKAVDRVEIREITFAPGEKTGAHLHPCPIVGYIASGGVILQVEGQEPQQLNAGDAFFEPANTKILRFDAIDQPTKFIAYYLLGKDDKELIRHLQ